MTCSALALALATLTVAQSSQPHPKSFWQAVAANKYEVPAGDTVVDLARELTDNLGSPDPELRDDLSFSILTSWIYQQKLLSPTDLRPMVAMLEGNLLRGVGETDGDRVVLRSFSALTLSVIAARENETPFLSNGEFSRLVDAALTYFHDERDLRGFDPARGWVHSAAHTSDLLKFLARNPKLTGTDQTRMLAALTAKNRDASVPFTQGEDERMARVVVSIVRRPDFNRDGFKTWLAEAQGIAKFPQSVTVDTLRAQQNVRHLLTALWTELSVDDRPSEGADFARAAVRDALKGAGF